MKLLTLAVLLGLASLMGCSSETAAVKAAQAEAEAARAELAKVKAESETAKTELAALKAQLAGLGGGSAQGTEEAVGNAVREFYSDLAQGRLRSAYESMSAAYKMRTERKAFDEFIEKHPSLASVARMYDGRPEFPAFKLRKLAKDNVYECDSQTSYIGEALFISNITLRVVQEDGAWKVDDFAEINDRKPSR